MAFKDEVAQLAGLVSQRKEVCRSNEEATKQALILPFLQILGYDVWNPKEIVPEYSAGFASREKVDYAIFLNNKPAIFVEAKAYGEKLINYDAQLAKYFNSTPEMKIAVITDGVTYKFFSDSEQLNIMDKEPLFEFQIESLRSHDFDFLTKLRKDSFDAESLRVEAENHLYLSGFMKKLRQDFNNPSEDFIRFLATDIYTSRLTAKAIERLAPLVKQAISTTLVTMVSKGLSQGIADDDMEVFSQESEPQNEAKNKIETNERTIETTEQELATYAEILKIISSEYGEDHGVNYKDTKSYFGIQIGKPNKWFCRLHFNNLKRIYIAFKLPLNQAQELVSPELLEPYVSSTTDGCLMTFETLDDLKVMKPLILAAFKNA